MNPSRKSVFAVLLSLVISSAAFADYDTDIQRGLSLRNSGDFAAAERAFADALNQAPESAEAASLLAAVIAFQQRFAEAMQVVDAGLRANPGNTDLLLTKARIHSYMRDFGSSQTILDELAVRDPNNLDISLLRARIAFYRKDWRLSASVFDQVLAADPDNLEALTGMYDLNEQIGKRQVAQNYHERAMAIAPNHEDVLRRQVTTAPQRPRHLVSMGYEHSRFDIDTLSRWRENFVEYRYIRGGQHRYLRLEQANRFDLEDERLTIGAIQKLAGRHWELALSSTNNAEFLPEYSALLATDVTVAALSGVSLRPSYRFNRYQTGNTHGVNLDMDWYLPVGGGWLSPGVGYLRDENDEGNSLWRLAWHQPINSRVRVGLDYTDAPETLNNATIDTETVHAYVNIRVFDKLSLRLDGSRHRRENAYVRKTYGLSLSWEY